MHRPVGPHVWILAEIHVEDAAGALAMSFDKKVLPRRIYTVTGGSYKMLGQIADIIRAQFPRADIELGAGSNDVQHEFDISAARRDLGYSARYDLEKGIRDYAAWLASRNSSK
jgi:UDP-glucuronate 4-epimerase